LKSFEELKNKSLDKSKKFSELSEKTDKIIDDKKSLVEDILTKITDEKSSLLPREDYNSFRKKIDNFDKKIEASFQENIENEDKIKSELGEYLQVTLKGEESAKKNLNQSIKSSQKIRNEHIKDSSGNIIKENKTQVEKYAKLANLLHHKLTEHHQLFKSQLKEIGKLSTKEKIEISKVEEYKENAQILALASGAIFSPESKGKFIEANMPPHLEDTEKQLYNCAGVFDENGNIYLGESYFNSAKYAKVRGKIDENGIVYRLEKNELTGQFQPTQRIGRVDKKAGTLYIGKDRFTEQPIAKFKDNQIETFDNNPLNVKKWGKII